MEGIFFISETLRQVSECLLQCGEISIYYTMSKITTLKLVFEYFTLAKLICMYKSLNSTAWYLPIVLLLYRRKKKFPLSLLEYTTKQVQHRENWALLSSLIQYRNVKGGLLASTLGVRLLIRAWAPWLVGNTTLLRCKYVVYHYYTSGGGTSSRSIVPQRSFFLHLFLSKSRGEPLIGITRCQERKEEGTRSSSAAVASSN